MSDSSRCYAYIHTDRLRHNVSVLKGAAKGKSFLAIVKADAYGHGAIEVSRAIEDIVDMLGVATVQEALELRNAGITSELLVLGYCRLEELKILAAHNISIAVYDAQYAKKQSQIAKENGFTLRCHLKINTGMNRLGIRYDEYDDILDTLNLDNFEFEGLFTHLAVADGSRDVDKSFTDTQHERFALSIDFIKKSGYNPRYIHSENTAGTMFCGYEGCNTVRCGIGMYGYSSEEMPIKGLQQVMRIYAYVVQVQCLKPGDTVSYGRTFKATKEMKVAVLNAGYADGYPRKLSSRGIVSIGGKSAKVIGRVCMDYITIDVSDIDNVQIGDRVEILGDMPATGIDEAASVCDTIVHEITCGFSARASKVYGK